MEDITRDNFLDEAKKMIENMEIDEPMDGDETESLANAVKFFLDVKNGNLSKKEIERGYRKLNYKR